MTYQRPEREPSQTIRHGLPEDPTVPHLDPAARPTDPAGLDGGPRGLDSPGTRHMPFTPDMLPDVPLYDTEPRRSGWWWLAVIGGVALLVVILSVAVILWSNAKT